jgi:cbb3-type cytochrome oxidase subunit 3
MQSFPAVDPIPLPAPIWLFKLLHIVTLSLHFVAVEMLLGGLLLAVILSLFRRSPHSQTAARALASRLTVVMMYVINLGVPPLLFAQVLYGRALYTSSVLIGAYWISIIALLTLAYWLLYQFNSRLEAGRSAWLSGLGAWVLAGFIARLLSTNMTLMLRPEVWRQMYSASAAGVYLPTGDPTTTPRWLLMLAGGLFIGGLWMAYLAGRSTFNSEEKTFLAATGGKVALVFGLIYCLCGIWAASVQPDAVKAGLATHPLYHWFGYAADGWLAFVVTGLAVAAFAGFRKITASWLGWAGALTALLLEITFTVYRDAVRDLTLLNKGYDVWDRAVVTNWSVVGLFLVLFVAGLGVVGWLISVVARAQKPIQRPLATHSITPPSIRGVA